MTRALLARAVRSRDVQHAHRSGNPQPSRARVDIEEWSIAKKTGQREGNEASIRSDCSIFRATGCGRRMAR